LAAGLGLESFVLRFFILKRCGLVKLPDSVSLQSVESAGNEKPKQVAKRSKINLHTAWKQGLYFYEVFCKDFGECHNFSRFESWTFRFRSWFIWWSLGLEVL